MSRYTNCAEVSSTFLALTVIDAHAKIPLDLRNPDTVPLNFTKSINLALSERGITAIKQSGRQDLIDKVLGNTIPMRGRMIHGRDQGKLWEAAQAYDVHGRVCGALGICIGLVYEG